MPNYTYNNRSTTLDPGEYPAEVVNASLEMSKKGNEMIVLTVLVNGAVEVTDFLVFTQKTFWKIDEFLNSTGLAPALGEEIDITPRLCMGAMGKVKIILEQGDNGRSYPKIETWVAADKSEKKPQGDFEEF